MHRSHMDQKPSPQHRSRCQFMPRNSLQFILHSKIHVQSAGVSQEEQIFYTNDDDETEEQYWARKEAIRKNPATDEPTVTIQTLSTNLVK